MLAPGYRVLERLHRSNLFDVFDAWDERRMCRCILKTPRPDRLDDRSVRSRLLREGRRLTRLAHPHIVRVVEVIDAPRPLVVQETLSGETLGHLIEHAEAGIDHESAAWLGLHLVSAIHHIHAAGLLHLDLKPSNVVAEGGRAVVIDLSSAAPPGRLTPGVGTWCYMAPEQVEGGRVDAAADVWGLGMVLHEVVTGATALPVERRTREADWVPSRLAVNGSSAPLAELIDGCLLPDPDDRPTLDLIAAQLGEITGTPFPPR